MTFRRIAAGDYWRYQLDGHRIVGVTTLIGNGIPKPAIINWTGRMAAEYAADHIDTLARMDRDEAVDLIKGAADRARNRAGVKGKRIHGFAERILAGEQIEVPDEYQGYVDGYLRWIDDWQPRVLAVEFALCNRRWNYAGSGDLLCGLRDEVAYVDVKTGGSGVFPESCLQAAAYRAAETMLDDEGREVPMPATDAGYALWLDDDGTYELLPLESGPEMFAVFLHACHVAAFMERKRDELIGLPMPSPAAAAS